MCLHRETPSLLATRMSMSRRLSKSVGTTACAVTAVESFAIVVWSVKVPSLLLRNNGDGTFTDQTTMAKLSTAVTAHAVVPTDFDNRRDIDILVASNEGVSLWRHMRYGTCKRLVSAVD